MKNVSLYIDITFCFVFLPLMLFAFPVERWWGTQPVYFATFTGWLYVTYFAYRYFIIPGLFNAGRRRTCALVSLAASLAITFLFPSYDISSPFYHLRQQMADVDVVKWGMRQNRQAVWLHYRGHGVLFCRRDAQRGLPPAYGTRRGGIRTEQG